MGTVTDVSQADANLAVVDLAAVPAPLTLAPDRVRAALRAAAGIKGHDAIGFTQLLDHLSDQLSKPTVSLDVISLVAGSGGD
jgi:hypothetical protein